MEYDNGFAHISAQIAAPSLLGVKHLRQMARPSWNLRNFQNFLNLERRIPVMISEF